MEKESKNRGMGDTNKHKLLKEQTQIYKNSYTHNQTHTHTQTHIGINTHIHTNIQAERF